MGFDRFYEAQTARVGQVHTAPLRKWQEKVRRALAKLKISPDYANRQASPEMVALVKTIEQD